jgi:hypothetical protein
VSKFRENYRFIGLAPTHFAGDTRVQGRSITEEDLASLGGATLGSPSTKRILMSASPFFGESAVACFTVHPDPQDCSLTYTPGGAYYGAALTRDKLIKTLSNATLINTNKFLCYTDACSRVIGNILVYSDIDHITIAYSSFISKGITSAVLAALK